MLPAEFKRFLQASADSVIAEGIALQKSDYATLGDNFYEVFNQEFEAEFHGPGVVSSVLFTFAKRALGWCMDETLRQVPKGVKELGSSMRQGRRVQKELGRKSRGAGVKDRQGQWAAGRSWTDAWELETDFSCDHELLYPSVTGAMSEPAWRMDDLLDSVDMSVVR